MIESIDVWFYRGGVGFKFDQVFPRLEDVAPVSITDIFISILNSSSPTGVPCTVFLCGSAMIFRCTTLVIDF